MLLRFASKCHGTAVNANSCFFLDMTGRRPFVACHVVFQARMLLHLHGELVSRTPLSGNLDKPTSVFPFDQENSETAAFSSLSSASPGVAPSISEASPCAYHVKRICLPLRSFPWMAARSFCKLVSPKFARGSLA